jgi:pantoate--beta-alanine ligase
MTAPHGLLITNHPAEVRRAVAVARGRGATIGFVPTMGALHAGHLSLIERARDESGLTVFSLFVNPAQFGAQEDLARYPRPIEQDLKLCRDADVDVVFVPDPVTMYPPGFDTWVEVGGLSAVLEGASRPGHFRGVATVVLKLLNIVQPDRAYFGAKDYQQQALIRHMAHDLDLAVEIVTCPTVREQDGLALSSRNTYLSPSERKSATALYESLQIADRALREGAQDVAMVMQAMRGCLEARAGVVVDYAVIADPATLAVLGAPQPQMVALVAARVGGTRLIDNLSISLDAAEETVESGPGIS